MKIKPDRSSKILEISREEGERMLYAESTFYRHLADKLNKETGTDFIPKRMFKDGHLMDDEQFYLVDRKRRFAFMQRDWAINDICRDYFNKNIPVKLRLFYLERDVSEDSKNAVLKMYKKLELLQKTANDLTPDEKASKKKMER